MHAGASGSGVIAQDPVAYPTAQDPSPMQGAHAEPQRTPSLATPESSAQQAFNTPPASPKASYQTA